jgi:hypothetical protein
MWVLNSEFNVWGSCFVNSLEGIRRHDKLCFVDMLMRGCTEFIFKRFSIVALMSCELQTLLMLRVVIN